MQAREAVHLPVIDTNIADYACQCTICTKHKASPLHSPCFPKKGKEYLLIHDQLSKYPVLYKISSKSTQSLCACLLKLISQNGPPSLLFTDKGQPFASEELTHFLQCHHIQHSTSSLHFPMSNGFIECQV